MLNKFLLVADVLCVVENASLSWTFFLPMKNPIFRMGINGKHPLLFIIASQKLHGE